MNGDGQEARVKQILGDLFEDRVYLVEDGVVWVSGMNEHCGAIARRMARELAHGHDVPASLVYDDDAVRFGGVQFNYGANA